MRFCAGFVPDESRMNSTCATEFCLSFSKDKDPQQSEAVDWIAVALILTYFAFSSLAIAVYIHCWVVGRIAGAVNPVHAFFAWIFGIIHIFSVFVTYGFFSSEVGAALLLPACSLWSFWLQYVLGFFAWFSVLCTRLIGISIVTVRCVRVRTRRGRVLFAILMGFLILLPAIFIGALAEASGDAFELSKSGSTCNTSMAVKIALMVWLLLTSVFFTLCAIYVRRSSVLSARDGVVDVEIRIALKAYPMLILCIALNFTHLVAYAAGRLAFLVAVILIHVICTWIMVGASAWPVMSATFRAMVADCRCCLRNYRVLYVFGGDGGASNFHDVPYTMRGARARRRSVFEDDSTSDEDDLRRGSMSIEMQTLSPPQPSESEGAVAFTQVNVEEHGHELAAGRECAATSIIALRRHLLEDGEFFKEFVRYLVDKPEEDSAEHNRCIVYKVVNGADEDGYTAEEDEGCLVDNLLSDIDDAMRREDAFVEHKIDLREWCAFLVRLIDILDAVYNSSVTTPQSIEAVIELLNGYVVEIGGSRDEELPTAASSSEKVLTLSALQNTRYVVEMIAFYSNEDKFLRTAEELRDFMKSMLVSQYISVWYDCGGYQHRKRAEDERREALRDLVSDGFMAQQKQVD